jgi:hypothetical protein
MVDLLASGAVVAFLLTLIFCGRQSHGLTGLLKRRAVWLLFGLAMFFLCQTLFGIMDISVHIWHMPYQVISIAAIGSAAFFHYLYSKAKGFLKKTETQAQSVEEGSES